MTRPCDTAVGPRSTPRYEYGLREATRALALTIAYKAVDDGARVAVVDEIRSALENALPALKGEDRG